MGMADEFEEITFNDKPDGDIRNMQKNIGYDGFHGKSLLHMPGECQ